MRVNLRMAPKEQASRKLSGIRDRKGMQLWKEEGGMMPPSHRRGKPARGC